VPSAVIPRSSFSRAMPKSMIFSPPVASMMMFCGLMSRWITPTSCAAARPAQICFAIRSPTGVGRISPASTSCLRVSPFTNSIER
jgi:hypothetical protein